MLIRVSLKLCSNFFPRLRNSKQMSVYCNYVHIYIICALTINMRAQKTTFCANCLSSVVHLGKKLPQDCHKTTRLDHYVPCGC